jgi:GPH family glycoside/pentoside/hexuronide:cation symporter
VSKIVCYDPEWPWLLLVPTALLSMGMLMFFTLASSMIADVCDADELATGPRAEGTYYSVFWWLLKMGAAVASLVGGALLVYTQFNESQNVTVGTLLGRVATLKADAETWALKAPPLSERLVAVDDGLRSISEQLDDVAEQFARRSEPETPDAKHTQQLVSRLDIIRSRVDSFTQRSRALAESPETLASAAAELLAEVKPLKAQSPRTLYRLRLVEIGLPLLLSVVSVALLIGYPLTEARCYEIKAALEERKRAAGG